MAEVEYIDLRPSQAYSGGGMIPEGEYDIADAKFAAWDYNGTRPNSVPALGIEYKNQDQSFIQWYSAGDMKNMKPAADGKRLEKVGTASSLNNQCNCFQFLTALVRCGFDEERIGHDIGSLVGMRVMVVHEPTVEREIGGQKKAAGSMAVIGKILSDPGAKDAKGKGKAATAGKKANGSETATSDAGVAEKTTGALIAALKGAKDRALSKKDLSTAMWAKIPGNDTDRPKVMNLIIQDAFLSSLVDKGVLYDQQNAQVMYVGE